MILIIDGGYFGQRIRNAQDLTFLDPMSDDRNKLFYHCTESLCNELKRIPNVTRIIICKDYSSWRKKVNVLRPKGLADETYKENRENEEKNYDVTAFFTAYNDWIQMLEDKLGIINVSTYEAEADDVCAILANGLRKNKVLLWSSDGDYPQLITDDIYLLKFPKRQLYLPLTQKPKENDFSGIFNLNTQSNLLLESFEQQNIVYENPMSSLFYKCVYGDKKDNVSPILFWNSSSGKVMKPSESYVVKALNDLETTLDSITETDIYNEDFVKNFIRSLLFYTKTMLGVDFKSAKTIKETYTDIIKYSKEVDEQVNVCYEIYKCNLNLKHLSKKQIPQDIVEGVIDVYKTKEKIPQHNAYDISEFEKTIKVLGIKNFSTQSSYFSSFDLNNIPDINN